MKSLTSSRRQDKIGFFARCIRLRPKKEWINYAIICKPCSKLHYSETWITKIIIKGIHILSVEILRNWPILPPFSFLLFAGGRVDGKMSHPSGVTGGQQKAWRCADQEWVIHPEWPTLVWFCVELTAVRGQTCCPNFEFYLTRSPSFTLPISFAKGMTFQWFPSNF